MEDDDRSSWVKGMGYFGAILADLIGFTGAGIGLGYLLSSKLGAPSWVMLPTGMAGLAVAFYRLYRMTVKDAGGGDQ
jgi:F0F1-type ATP synthase assembly protein I